MRSALAAVQMGRGSTIALTGPPGIGKSRLLREAVATADTWGLTVLRGRSVPSGSASAFRPLTEALLGGLRHAPVPDDPMLTPFTPALARILPQWRAPGPRPDDSLVVLGEAVLRLLTVLGPGGIVLALEDLHWADPDTLTVVEYLADTIAVGRILLIVTARDEPGPAADLLRGLDSRDACTVLALPPLTGPEIGAMAAACLGGEVPAATEAALRRRAGGTPLLVEELLAAGIDPAVAVPPTVSELVVGRLATLSEGARRCVEVAAVLGRRFDWRLLPGSLGAAESDVLAALRAATATGLVEPEGEDEFRFHHALGRDAVLAAMLPPERAWWARRALDELVALHPELDGSWCDLAADLALRAGDRERAATLLHEAGRRNLTGGALASAEAALTRAAELVVAGTDLAVAIDETRADVLAQSGRTHEALAAAVRVIEGAAPGVPTARAHLRRARVHATAGNWAAARADLETAGTALGDPPVDDALALRVASAATHVELGAGRLADAASAARTVLSWAERSGSAEPACEALLVLGRLARRDDRNAAEEIFLRARRTAEDAGLTLMAARAAAELCIADAQYSLRLDRLADARDRAAATGDLAGVAVLDLQTAAAHSARWELDEAVAAADRCIATSRRLQLPTLPKALVLRAAAEALRGARPPSNGCWPRPSGSRRPTPTCSGKPRERGATGPSRWPTTPGRYATSTRRSAHSDAGPTRSPAPPRSDCGSSCTPSRTPSAQHRRRHRSRSPTAGVKVCASSPTPSRRDVAGTAQRRRSGSPPPTPGCASPSTSDGFAYRPGAWSRGRHSPTDGATRPRGYGRTWRRWTPAARSVGQRRYGVSCAARARWCHGADTMRTCPPYCGSAR